MTVTDSAGRELIFESAPHRIATVIPGDMEIIYALGGELAARPQSSGEVRPPEAESLDVIGHPHDINFEILASLGVDLFIGHSRVNMKDIETLEALGINVLLSHGDSFEDIIGLINLYGRILDKGSEAEQLIHEIENEINALIGNQPEQPMKTLILFGTVDETMAALPQSLVGSLFELVGTENVASGLPRLDRYPTYAQLSLERVLEANPDVIYFMAHGDPQAVLDNFQSEMSKNPAWNNLTAVKNDNLIILPHSLFGTNPGPRIVESLQYLSESLESITIE
ncbi:hypothetical protein BKP45_07905 [Anaerobacillus alkalidiazotrophicus]|uniref:Fe/B12 periplasmic-binding domain-containing protein n=1 Tax=Anaerobacillus alkalidiazotrophicus TaxID=472963 RepID=A0A1S2M8G3_9BACI|nr:hypothetical protein BKP45_07905 [Anaerobacillus alkalidiazotrophicus]